MVKTFYTNGGAIKNIDFPQYPDSAWNFTSGAPETKDNNELYERVAAVFRAANMGAEALASLPFALVDKRGEDFDISDDWQNKVGFLPNPRELFRLWRLSLFMTNSAYGFMESGGGKNLLRYINPITITPIVNASVGLTGFKRTLGTTVTEYSLAEKRILYLWRQDHTTELLPARGTEFRASMAAAGVLFYADYFTESFFSRGGIKPTMLSVKGVANVQDREKIENIWDKITRGMYKYLGKVFNADAVTATVIGEGIDNLKDSALHEEKLADIAMAAGMPLSLLLANSANYATAQTEYITWFRDSVTPWANFMADQVNDQLFSPMGLKLEFRPEMSDPGQEDEVQRADAFSKYVTSGVKPSIAAQIVGVELPNGIEYEDLDPDIVDESDPSTDTMEDNVPEPVVEPVSMPAKFVPSIEQLRELDLWQTFAFRKLKRGESLIFPFTAKTLPDEIADTIRVRLEQANGADEIKAAFEITDLPDIKSMPDIQDQELIELIEVLNRVASMGELSGVASS